MLKTKRHELRFDPMNYKSGPNPSNFLTKIETDLSGIDFREALDNVEDSVDDILLAEMIIVRRESTDRAKEPDLRLVRSSHR